MSGDVETGGRGAAAYLSIGGLSRATQVPMETLRTWEQRYGFPRPVRKPSGHRQYDVSNVARIRRIGEALARGARAGDVVGASEEALAAILAAMPDAGSPEGANPAPPMDLPGFLDAIRRFDGDRLMRALRSDLARTRPIEYLETRVAPLVTEIGEAWRRGDIDVAQEHFASERVSDALRAARLGFEETASGSVVVLATLPGEAHGLGVQMAALILSAVGARCVVLGTEVPEDLLAARAEKARAAALALSFSVATRRTARQATLALRARLAPAVDLVVGGAGAPKDVAGVTTVATLADLDSWARARLTRVRRAG